MSANTAHVVGTTSSNITPQSRQYTVKYRVETTDKNDQSVTAVTAPGLPGKYNYYAVGNDTDTGAYVSGYSAQLQSEDGGRKLWDVFVTFSTANRDRDPAASPWENAIDTPPWLLPAKVRGSGRETVRLITRSWSVDGSGNDVSSRVLNACKEPPPVEEDQLEAHPTLNISRAYLTIDLDLLIEYANTVNSVEFFGQPAGRWRMGFPQWQRMYTPYGQVYYEVDYTFESSEEGWNGKAIINQGMTYYGFEDGTLKRLRFKDDEDMVLNGPGLLDPFGYQLDADEPPYYLRQSGGSIIFQQGESNGNINPYRERDFSNLGIPTSLETVP
jgi:hypothetical protein